MKSLKFTLLAAALIFAVAPASSEEHEIRDNKTLKKCWLYNSKGEIVKVGSFCATGTSQCSPNPC